MAEWPDTRFEHELRVVLRREVDSLPLVVTPSDVLTRRHARRRTLRRPWMALVAAALLVVPLSLAAGIGVLAPAERSPYLAVLARGLTTNGLGSPREGVGDLELVLVGALGHEDIVVRVPASSFGGWQSTRQYALSPNGRWLAIPLKPATTNGPDTPPSALGVLDLSDPTRVRVLTGGRLAPRWTVDGTLWWRVGDSPEPFDPATGTRMVGRTPVGAPVMQTPSPGVQPAGPVQGTWEFASRAWAADGGTWTLVRQDPNTSDVSRLVHEDRDGNEWSSPEFPGSAELSLRPDALVMAPDDSLAAIRRPLYRRVTGEVSPGGTIVVDVGAGQAVEHIGWLVGFVRSDAAATWTSTQGGSR